MPRTARMRPFLRPGKCLLGWLMDRDQEPDDEPIALLRVSKPRRLFGTAMQAGLGVLLIVVAIRLPDPSTVSVAALVGVGLLALLLARWSYRATDRELILTRKRLYDSTGEDLALIDDIVSVDRGTFAFKPSNGFLMKVGTPAPRRWVPGLWWRLGTRIGVGGATNGKAAREVADLIVLLQKGMLPRREDLFGSDPEKDSD